MPAWIEDRVRLLREKNPKMEKGMAYGIATEQHKKLAEDLTPVTVSVDASKDGAEALVKLIKRVHQIGSVGHSFGIVEDDPPSGERVSLGGWDGDGACRIGKITVTNGGKSEEVPLKDKLGMGFKPGAWRAQAGFTPVGMKTPAQRLQKTMNVGKFDSAKGLSPLSTKMAAKKQEEDLGLSPAEKAFTGGIVADTAGTLGIQRLGTPLKARAQEEIADKGSAGLVERVLKTSPVPVLSDAEVPTAYFRPAQKPLLTKLEEMRKSPFVSKLPAPVRAVMEAQTGALGPVGRAEYLARQKGIDVAKPHVVMGKGFKSPSILAHEIGHAQLDKSRLGKLLQNRATMRLSAHSAPVALLSGALAGSTDDKRLQALGAAGVASTVLPELGYEAGASMKALKSLRGLGADPGQLRSARRVLVPAFGTYAGKGLKAVGAGALGTSVALGIRQKLEEKKKEKTKTSGINERRLETQPMTRHLGAEVPNSAFKVKAGGETDDCECTPKAKVKAAFTMSEYSGDMNPEPIKHQSYLPPFSAPPVRTVGKLKKANLKDTPVSLLAESKAVGAPKMSPAKGPSIAQISKPVGIGTPIPGATKTGSLRRFAPLPA